MVLYMFILFLFVFYYIVNGYLFHLILLKVLSIYKHSVELNKIEERFLSVVPVFLIGFIITNYIIVIISVFEVSKLNIIVPLLSLALLYILINRVRVLRITNICREYRARMSKLTYANIEDVITLLMFAIIISFIIQKMQWPPLGDTLLIHGPLTMMQYYNKKVTFVSIYNGMKIRYPIGVHVIIANLYCVVDNLLLLPQMILIFHGLLIVMVLCTIYYISSLFTNKKLGMTLTLTLFYISSVKYRWLENWFMGQLYNGTLTWTYGILLLLVLIFVEIELSDIAPSYGRIIKSMIYVLLLISYPNFFILAVFVDSIKLIVKLVSTKVKSINLNKFGLKNFLPKDILSILIFIIPLVGYSPNLISILSYNTQAVTKHFYSTKSSLLNDPLFIVLSSITLILILYNIVIGNIKKINKSFVFLFILGVAISVAQYFLNNSLLNIFTPRRILLFVFVSTIPISLYMLRYVKTKHNIFKKFILMILVMIALVTLSLGLYPQLTSDKYAKILYKSRVYDDKIDIYRYIYNNVSYRDVILAEPTWSSLWLYSVKVVNSTYWLGDYYTNSNINQSEVFKLFLGKISNNKVCNYLANIIKKYNISYILITEDKTIVIKDPASRKILFIPKRVDLYNMISSCKSKNIHFKLILKIGENALIRILRHNSFCLQSELCRGRGC